jgi:hypothetical protein
MNSKETGGTEAGRKGECTCLHGHGGGREEVIIKPDIKLVCGVELDCLGH